MDVIRRWYGRSAIQGILVLGSLGCVVLAGCDSKYKPSLTDDETRMFSAKQKPVPPPAMAVSGETITVDTIYNYRKGTFSEYLKKLALNSDWDTFKEVATKQIKAVLDNMIDEILLYQQAKREAGDKKKMEEGLDKATNSEWRRYVVEHGGDEATAEEALRKENIDRKEFDEKNRRAILISTLVSLRFPKDQPVSHREVVDYYNRMKDREFAVKPRLTFRLIDIQPARLQLTDLTMDRHAQAMELADDLMARLVAGEDFGQLARQYSHDPMAGSGGLWSSIDPQSLADPYDALAAKIEALPMGIVEGPIEIQGHVFIVRLEDSQEQGYQPLEEVQSRIEARIRSNRIKQAQDKLEAELAERAKVGQTGPFVEGCVAEIYRRSKATP